MSFVIKNTVTGRIHREPTRAPWKSKEYKSISAAKAGVTRTLKYYQKAIESVREAEEQGLSAYTSSLYNAYQDATDENFGRTYVNKPETYEIMSREEYGEPMVTRTGRSPYNGNEITVTININDVGTHMDPLCESHYTR